MSDNLMGALLLANEEAKRARGKAQALEMEIADLRAEVKTLVLQRNDQWEKRKEWWRRAHSAETKIGRSARRASEAQRIEAANRKVCNDALARAAALEEALGGLLDWLDGPSAADPRGDLAVGRARRVMNGDEQ